MSLAFRIAIAPAACVRTIAFASHGIGLAGVAACAAPLARAWGWPLAAVLATAGLALLAWSLRCSLRAGLRGHLSVDGNGAARWAWAETRSAAPLDPVRWQVIGPVVCIEGVCDGRRVCLLSGVRAIGEQDRSRLLAWLRWLDRGGIRRQPAQQDSKPVTTPL